MSRVTGDVDFADRHLDGKGSVNQALTGSLGMLAYDGMLGSWA
jgi:hypothetical protein